MVVDIGWVVVLGRLLEYEGLEVMFLVQLGSRCTLGIQLRSQHYEMRTAGLTTVPHVDAPPAT
jgi:hypothetical protein